VQLTLIRHAQPEWVRDGLSVDNPPLTALGRAQAERLATRLERERFDEIHVSPLVRTRETAAPLLARLRREESIQPWLEEIRNPIWHGTPVEKAAEAWREMKRLPSAERWSGLEGGESVTDFVQRINIGCSLFLEERGIRRADTDLPVWTLHESFVRHRKICLVAHAGTGSVSLCHMLGLQPTPWEWERFVIGHASVSRVQLFEIGDGATFSMVRLSDNEHLPEGLRTY